MWTPSSILHPRPGRCGSTTGICLRHPHVPQSGRRHRPGVLRVARLRGCSVPSLYPLEFTQPRRIASPTHQPKHEQSHKCHQVGHKQDCVRRRLLFMSKYRRRHSDGIAMAQQCVMLCNVASTIPHHYKISMRLRPCGIFMHNQN